MKPARYSRIALALVGWLATAEAPRAPRATREVNVKISIQIPKDEYLLGESIPVEMKLTNSGASAVEVPDPSHPANWQPNYTLNGPGYPDGVTFSFRSAKTGDGKLEPEGAAPALRKLAPGESASDAFFLGERVALKEPGQYRLTAQLNWKGLQGVSETRVLTLSANSFLSASLGVDMLAGSSRLVRVVWLGEGSGSRRMGESVFYESRPDLGEMEFKRMRVVRSTGTAARDPLCPWTNYDRAGKMGAWYAWRDGARLLALPMGDRPPFELAFGEDFHVVRPLLLPPSLELDVFALSGDGKRLMLGRFHHPDLKGNAAAPSVLWSEPLPAAAVSAACILGPAQRGSPRRLAITGQQGASLVVSVVNAGGGARAEVRTLRVPNGYALPNSQPAVWVDEEGRTRAAVVFSRNAQGTELAVLDATVPEKAAGAPETRVTAIGTVEPKLKAAAATYPVTAGAPLVREWVALLEDGRMIHSSAPHSRVALEAPPALPLQLVRLSSVTYVLLLTPGRGPQLVQVP